MLARMFEVTTVTVHGKPTAVGSAGPFTLVVDRPVEAGGRGVGFNGGERLKNLVERVDGIAEIPNSLRGGTAVRLGAINTAGAGGSPGNPLGCASHDDSRAREAVLGPTGLREPDGEGRNRTGDPTVFSRVLYQLSYLARSRQV